MKHEVKNLVQLIKKIQLSKIKNLHNLKKIYMIKHVKSAYIKKFVS